jgi:signal-transduction protein with cAMP-binding, CBS, and nucleotidyltransferase domain
MNKIQFQKKIKSIFSHHNVKKSMITTCITKLCETLCSKLVGGVVQTMKSTWRNFLVVFVGAHYGHDYPS